MMNDPKYHFSTSSNKKLKTCDPDIQEVFNGVIGHVDCTIIEGHRSEDRQNDLFHTKKSKLMWPRSKHNGFPSNAVDCVIYPIKWEDTERNYFFGGFVKGYAAALKDLGEIDGEVRWGGDWDGDNDLHDQTFNDLVHFEIK